MDCFTEETWRMYRSPDQRIPIGREIFPSPPGITLRTPRPKRECGVCCGYVCVDSSCCLLFVAIDDDIVYVITPGTITVQGIKVCRSDMVDCLRHSCPAKISLERGRGECYFLVTGNNEDPLPPQVGQQHEHEF